MRDIAYARNGYGRPLCEGPADFGFDAPQQSPHSTSRLQSKLPDFNRFAAMLPKPYLLLSLVDHQLVPLEANRHGGSPDSHARYLNVDGRWAIHGIARAPLLVWDISQVEAARAAADRSTRSRDRQVAVAQRGDSNWEEGKHIQLFSDVHEPALHGHAAHSEAKARRLRTEVEKLAAFCSVVLAAAAAKDQTAFLEVSRAAGIALRQKFGGGSVSTCSAWLAGAKGSATLESVLAGEVELVGTLSLEQIVQTVELARNAEKLAP